VASRANSTSRGASIACGLVAAPTWTGIWTKWNQQVRALGPAVGATTAPANSIMVARSTPNVRQHPRRLRRRRSGPSPPDTGARRASSDARTAPLMLWRRSRPSPVRERGQRLSSSLRSPSGHEGVSFPTTSPSGQRRGSFVRRPPFRFDRSPRLPMRRLSTYRAGPRSHLAKALAQ
jgi:hypothetical protein